jgi:hypothetical protein
LAHARDCEFLKNWVGKKLNVQKKEEIFQRICYLYVKGVAALFFQYGTSEIDHLKNTGADTARMVPWQAFISGRFPREPLKE